MQEQLYHYWVIIRRHLEQIAIAIGLALLVLVFFLRAMETPQIEIEDPKQGFAMNDYFPPRQPTGRDAYNIVVNFLELAPDIEQVEGERYTILLKHNPFDKKHAVPESEIEQQLIETFNQARSAFDSGNYQRCIELCTEIIDLDPTYLGAVQLLRNANQKIEQTP